ncbi:ubiquinone anaerobic biosynthesis accessory factor UbiT [Candidatus Thioglobus autotrophicus]|uniref:ubiquinone anaerobic biosynthesis accessory factor UbiT n=1 Tax=Candidatus Thioglobus autotrophicus TaxID=1705394 RepID=UPI0011875E92|nr:SCP2 sterol-binding domain-containing protein [Candidatus Thioglobus autotrophicus]WPE16457.1 SCP2 sterol-binding domain-containing protein [Candidatus Thioglobus autotrophicus]WPE18004.1 SCP2 sterol-binding domain-containing protein [Candidatus Thioglobus autotrophicus]
MSFIRPPIFLPIATLTQVSKTINNKIIVSLFNQIFSQAIKTGDLDFLEGRWVLIEILDMGLTFNLGFNNQRLIQAQQNQVFDLTISARSCDFLDLMSKNKDPDTLFFQRKINMQGSTELGLYVKNFLDAFDVEVHWASAGVDKILQNTYPILSKLLCRKS